MPSGYDNLNDWYEGSMKKKAEEKKETEPPIAIDNFDTAKMRFLKALGKEIKDSMPDGYAMFLTTHDGERYCICFKREYYQNFQFHFPSLGKVGWGQIANKELIERCAKGNFTYVAIMPDGKMYQIDPTFWLNYYTRFKTDVPHLEGEIAVPMKLFKRFGND
jgi:hypothetical protein